MLPEANSLGRNLTQRTKNTTRRCELNVLIIVTIFFEDLTPNEINEIVSLIGFHWNLVFLISSIPFTLGDHICLNCDRMLLHSSIECGELSKLVYIKATVGCTTPLNYCQVKDKQRVNIPLKRITRNGMHENLWKRRVI